jgi:chromosome segregation ATPase
MQTKGLFAALLCGAMCLTGCLKNIESESVSEVRKGKAKELISQANLNDAMAQAEVIKANAEATIAEAQAKLLEAQAAIAEAEALRLTIQAQLDEVNVQIAMVKLEEEKVKLQAQKAKLQQLLAEVEAAIAKADLAKQEALNRLAKAQMQAQIDQVNMQKKLVEAQAELDKEIAKMEENTAKALRKAWWNYSQALNKYYEAVAQKVEKEAAVARMEDDLYYGLYELSNQAAYYQQVIEQYNAEIEFLESFINHSSSEIMEMADQFRKDYTVALTNVAIAEENEQTAGSAYYTLWYLQDDDPDYDRLEYTNNWQGNFVTYLENTGANFVLQVDPVTEMYTQGIMVQKEGELPVFTPLFTGYASYYYGRYIADHGYVYENPDTYELYPAIENGIRSAYAEAFPTQFEFVPANIFTENINAFIDENLAETKKYYAQQQEDLEKLYNQDKSGYLNYDGVDYVHVDGVVDEISYYQALVNGMQVYVEEADQKLEPLEQQSYVLADDLDKALVAKAEIANKLTELDKGNTLRAAFNIADANWDEARMAFNQAQNDLDNLQNDIAYQRFVIIGYGEPSGFYMEGLSTTAAKAKAAKEAKEAEVAALEAKITTKIKNDYETSKAALETLNSETIPGLIDKEREAFDAWQAKVQAKATYADAVTDTELAKAKKAHDDALEALNKALADAATSGDPDKPSTYDVYIIARDAYNAVYDPYKAAYDQLNGVEPTIWGLVQEAERCEAMLKEAQEELKKLEEELGKEATETEPATGAFKKVDDAKEAMDKAKADRDAAFAPIAPMAEDPAEVKALKEEQEKAIKAVDDKIEEMEALKNEFFKIQNAYNKYDFYVKELDPEYAPEANHNHYAEDMWGWKKHDYKKKPSTAQRLADAQEHLLFIEDSFAKQTQLIADALDAEEKEAETVKANIARLDTFKADYMAWGETLVAADVAYIDAQKAVIDAQIAASEVYAQYYAINDLINGVVVVYQGENYTIEEVEDLIYYYKTGLVWDETTQKYVKDETFVSINDLYELIEEIEYQIEAYKVDEKTNIQVLAKLNAELEALNKKIEVYNALVEMYAAQIAELTGTTPEVE